MTKQYRKLMDMGRGSPFRSPTRRCGRWRRLAVKRKAGARGLRAVMEHLMMEIMFEAPGNPRLKQIHVTEEMVRSQFAEPGAILKMLLAAAPSPAA